MKIEFEQVCQKWITFKQTLPEWNKIQRVESNIAYDSKDVVETDEKISVIN